MKLRHITEAQYAYRGEPYTFAGGRKFVPDALISPNSDQANKILGRQQLPKVNKLAEILGVEWNAMYVKRFMQGRAYNTTRGRMVWSYILVGEDQEGNEIAYYKYEGGTSGSGQSWVYSNKQNKIKLSFILNSPERAKKILTGEKSNQPARRITKRRVIEARYSGQSQEMFFLVEETGDMEIRVKLVGPFASINHAKKFEAQLQKDFTDVVITGPTDVYGVISPEKYYEDAQYEHNWWTELP